MPRPTELRVTLLRGDSCVDIHIVADDAVTVGLLAEYLARCEIVGQSNPYGTDGDTPPVTLRVLVPGATTWVMLWARDLLRTSHLASGAMIDVIPIGRHAAGDAYSRQPAGFLRCLAGPLIGQLFPLTFGENLVGRGDSCDVVLADPEVSRAHCVIGLPSDYPHGRLWELHDVDSRNGTKIDRSGMSGPVLHFGQTSAIIQPANEVWTGVASPLPSPAFVRSPRLGEVSDAVQITMPRSPQKAEKSRPPILAMCAPLGIGVLMATTMKSTMGLMFLVMSPLVMVAHHFDTSFSGKRRLRSASAKFDKDLARVTEELRQGRILERTDRLKAAPGSADVNAAIWERDSLLWARRVSAPNFTEVRFGTGEVASSTLIDAGATEDPDSDNQRRIQSLVSEYATVSAVPIVSKLTDCGNLGIVGTSQETSELAASVVLQLAGLHAPDELQFRVLGDAAHAELWSWVKWLPHAPVKSNAIAGHLAAEQLLQNVEELIAHRAAAAQPQLGVSQRECTVVILVLSTRGIDRARLAAIAEGGAAQQVHVIWVADELTQLPAACRTYVQLGRRPHVGYTNTGQQVDLATTERTDSATAMHASRRLSGVVDADALALDSSAIPAAITWRDAVEFDPVGRPELVAELWATQGPSELAAVVGQGKDGPVTLSLRAHGPHALVGGTTGAGKSEFLQTWLMALAVAHSPEQLNFLLVDYKGGAAFAECVQLPHTVGLVTDLSLGLVHRVLKSLRAELRYREHVLNEAGVKDLIELERLGTPGRPPALVIVVDEFAALVAEVPEFVDGMVDIAQRGRSLGLHLVLATQRPAGVIRDNLRANTNLRIALRMADATDSQDVVGVRHAADFDPSIPGRALMGVGSGAPVEFQTGYLGAVSGGSSSPMIRVSELPFLVGESRGVGFRPPEDLAERTDRFGEGLDRADTSADGADRRGKRRDIERLLGTVQEASRVGGYSQPRVPWLPPLPDLIDGEALAAQDGGLPGTPGAVGAGKGLVLAVRDEPDAQRQVIARFEPESHGHLLVIGTSGSGKTTTLRTAVLAASTQGWQIYVVDAAGGALADLAELPTVGAVIRSDDAERVDRLFRLLHTELLRREQLDPLETCPRMMLVIDGFGVFREAYERDWAAGYLESLARILAVGRQLGIHVVVAAERVGAVPGSLAAAFQSRVVLRLGASSEYLNADVDEALLTDAPPGRGVVDGSEVQIAVWGSDGSQVDQRAATRRIAERLSEFGWASAPRVLALPDLIRWEDLQVGVGFIGKTAAEIPREGSSLIEVARSAVGIRFDDLEVATVPRDGLVVVAGGRGSGRTSAIRALLKTCSADGAILLSPQLHSELAESFEWAEVALGVARVVETLTKVARLLGIEIDVPGSQSLELFGGEPELIFDGGVVANGTGALSTGGDADIGNVEMVGVAPELIVIESSAEFDGAERLLSMVIRGARRRGVRVIVEVDTATAGTAWAVHIELKGAAVGIFLQPDDSDAISLFRVAFPRASKSDFPAGRGYLVERGRCHKVQIALVD